MLQLYLSYFLPQTHWICPHAPTAHKTEVFRLGAAHSDLMTGYLGPPCCTFGKEELTWAEHS